MTALFIYYHPRFPVLGRRKLNLRIH